MRPTIEIEITNNPASAGNPVESFVQALVSDARKPVGKHHWEKIISPKPGFRIRNNNGAETLLTCDSQDDQHIQYSLHNISADGDATINSIEWVARGSETESDLHELYSLLEQKNLSVKTSANKQVFASAIAERLVSALIADARNLKSVIWAPEVDTGQEYRSYHAEGNSHGSKISIIPDSINDDSTTFTFIYEVEGQEVVSTVETAPTEAHSALRDLYYAIAGKDICEENPELTRISRFIASLREKDYLDRILNDDFPQRPVILVLDIFKQCNLRAVCGAYARTLAKQNPEVDWTTERMNENFAAAKNLITQIRAIPRCPNGKLFKEKNSKVQRKVDMRYDSERLNAIANSGCTILQEFYCGLPEKCAINRTAHLLLVAMLN